MISSIYNDVSYCRIAIPGVLHLLKMHASGMRSGERYRRNKSLVASLWRDICRIICGLTFSSLNRFRVAVEGRDVFPAYVFLV